MPWFSGTRICISLHNCTNGGSVNSNAVSFVSAWFSLSLLFTRNRSRPLTKLGRSENPVKSDAFSKRYALIFRVHGETASIWVRLSLWREICIVRFKMVNLASIAALAYAITTLDFGLSSLFQLSCILPLLIGEVYHNHRQRLQLWNVNFFAASWIIYLFPEAIQNISSGPIPYQHPRPFYWFCIH